MSDDVYEKMRNFDYALQLAMSAFDRGDIKEVRRQLKIMEQNNNNDPASLDAIILVQAMADDE